MSAAKALLFTSILIVVITSECLPQCALLRALGCERGICFSGSIVMARPPYQPAIGAVQ